MTAADLELVPGAMIAGKFRLERVIGRGGMGSVWAARHVQLDMPVALKFMIRVNEWIGTSCEFWEEADYVSFVLKLLLAFGLAFELPVVVLALGSMGIVSSEQLRDKRRHVIIGLLVLAMFLTPADPYTMILMAAPMTVLYEFCIWMTWYRERKGLKEEG